MPHPFDSAAVRDWLALALEAVGEGREEIDAINVFPVADGDTGTNLLRTLDAAARSLDTADGDPAAPALRVLARGALLGACGNSGTILAQLLRGMAEVYAEAEGRADGPEEDAVQVPGDGRLLALALRRAADAAYEAVARPVEGTMLTVARAAADAAAHAADGDPRAAAHAVARAAHEGAVTALRATTGQLDALRRAGVVDAGGSGLATVLDALAQALAGSGAVARPVPAGGAPQRIAPEPAASSEASEAEEAGADAEGPAYEVMYLLHADDAAVGALRERLDALGDSLVVGGGDGLWSVHVHVDDAGGAVEAGVAAGRPHRIRITHLLTEHTGGADGAEVTGGSCTPTAAPSEEPFAPAGAAAGRRAVVAVVRGDGLAGLCEEAGALVVRAGEGGQDVPGSEELAAAVRATGATEVVLLPNDAELHAAAAHAAEGARASAAGVRVAVVPTRAAVQGIAALAVHDPERRFDDDVVAMTAAAGATRYGEVTVAERRWWTTAGVCQAGEVLGLVEGDVAVIGSEVADTAAQLLERMLAAGGELVTLVVGEQAPEGLAHRLEQQVRGGHLAVDTVVYEGRQPCAPLLIGVE